MKRIISMICVILTLSVLLCACGNSGGSGKATEEAITGTPIGTDALDKLIGKKNEFYNPNNHMGAYDTVDIRPCRLYWENGQLIAECFVINSKNVPVYNIEVKNLRFGNADGIFAEAAFGVLDGAVIGANSYITWTFSFGSDVVNAYGADLTGSIDSGNNVSFNF